MRKRTGERETNLAEALIVYGDEPISFDEATTSTDKRKWLEAMNEEYNSLMKNQTWDLTNVPTGSNLIKCKWIFKIKVRIDGSIKRYKARFVAKGYSQIEGIDYKETFSPVVRQDSIRLLLSIVAREDLEIQHFDSKTAFVHGTVE